MKTTFTILFWFAAFSIQQRSLADPSKEFKQSLNEAITEIKSESPLLQSSIATAEAAHFQADGAKSNLLPNLSLQGNYFYQTNVPSLNIGPIDANFGTHNNYSAGPVLSYTLFDGGKDRGNADSAIFQALAREKGKKSQEAQLELSTKQAYFRVQYALRQLELTIDSLKLSLAQNKDIENRYQAGAASRLDEVQAKRDVISYQLKFHQAQSDLANSFRDLLALEGNHQELDTSRPMPARGPNTLPAGVEAPSLTIDLERLETSLSAAETVHPLFSASLHPEVKTYEAEAQASKRLADSEKGGLYPRIVLQAKAMYEYPNVVIPETVWQETFGASLVFPLYEGDASRSRANQYLKEASANEFLKQQKLTDLTRDEAKANDGLISLKKQKSISDDNVAEAEEVEKLTYQSYRAGKSRYLDVEDANLKLLEAQVSSAQISSEILNELAILNYLSAE
jgi:outer membrane protein TolC